MAQLRSHLDKSPSLLARVTVPLVSVALVLVAAEVALRLAGHGEPTGQAHAELLRHHPQLGWELTPDKTVIYPWQGLHVRESINSDGFRGPRHPREKPAREFRVLLLGDSFCEGYLVNDGEVVSAEMVKQWPATGEKKLAVVNGGVVGYSTDQELLAFRKKGIQYVPDVTIVLFFDNDVWFNAQSQEYRSRKPVFELRDGQLALTEVPVAESLRSEPGAGSQTHGLLRWLDARSHVYRTARDGVKTTPALRELAVAVGWLDESSGSTVSRQQGRAPIPNEFGVYARELPADTAAAWRLTEALLAELKQETAAIGSRLIVFYIPTSPAVYDDAWDATKELYGMTDSAWDIRRPEAGLGEICGRLGIEFIPAIDRFRHEAQRLKAEGKTLYYKQEGHWNPEGHRFAASLLVEGLKSQ